MLKVIGASGLARGLMYLTDLEELSIESILFSYYSLGNFVGDDGIAALITNFSVLQKLKLISLDCICYYLFLFIYLFM